MTLTTLSLAVVSSKCVVAAATENSDSSQNATQDGSYTLNRHADNPGLYALVLSDNDERTISGSFSIEQLQILKAIMTEAEKFAFSGEAAGTRDPITTRFEDKQESAFAVDVEKLGFQSTLFITLNTELGRITLVSGRVIRSTRRQGGFFFDLLSRLESILPKKPAKPSN